jgi:hypothetical protein
VAGCRTTGSSLYDQLGTGFTLVGPVHGRNSASLAALVRHARRRGIPLSLVDAPPSYPWPAEFLLVRPDQHIAWRATDPADIDLDLVTGHRPRA